MLVQAHDNFLWLDSTRDIFCSHSDAASSSVRAHAVMCQNEQP